MIEPLIRTSLALVISLLVQAFCLAIKVIVVLSNYLACQSAFQLLNYDNQPLNRDELLGWIFEPFVGGEATLCHLYALGLALTQAMGLFWLFHYTFRIIILWRERRWYLEHYDSANAQAALSQIWMNLFSLVCIAIPLVFIIYWDICLFRYRSIANMQGLEDGVIAPTSLLNWDLQLENSAHLFGWQLTGIGAWGYIGATAMVCQGFEQAFLKTQDNWARWVQAVSNLFQREAELPGQPGYANGYQERPQAAGGGPQQPPAMAPAAPAPAPAVQEAPRPANPAPGEHPREDTPPPARPLEPSAAPDLRPVIGGQPGEMASLAQASEQPQRYYVDPVTHDVWDRQAYEELFGRQEAA